MAFHNHLPLQRFSEQHLNTDNASILRDIIPNHHHHHHHHHHPSSSAVNSHAPPHSPHGGAPTWLNNVLRQQNPYPDSNFLNLHTASESTASVQQQQQQVSNQWISRPIMQRNSGNGGVGGGGGEEVPVSNDSMMGGVGSISPDSADVNNSSNHNSDSMTVIGHSGKINGGGESDGGGDSVVNWQNARYKADILAHPLYEQLLSAHVTCLRIATPVDHLPRIDAQLAQSQQVVSKYSALALPNHSISGDDKELDQFMTHYVLLLCSFKEQLQQHVRVHAMEAVMACWEIEQSLHSLTGVSPGEGTGATMSDDDDEMADSDTNLFDGGLDGPDGVGFGPLIPTESERSLMERVRQELKHELKQGYKEKIVDIREEILRKRRAGKLPGNTTSVLKSWWQSHSKWPYPTEEDKAKLVQQTGLQLKQINNWFINQRKRNWHSNPSSSTVLKTKRKSNAGDNSGGFI